MTLIADDKCLTWSLEKFVVDHVYYVMILSDTTYSACTENLT